MTEDTARDDWAKTGKEVARRHSLSHKLLISTLSCIILAVICKNLTFFFGFPRFISIIFTVLCFVPLIWNTFNLHRSGKVLKERTRLLGEMLHTWNESVECNRERDN